MARILVVDDEPLTAAVLTLFLQDLGHQVRRAGSVREALQAGASGPIDLLLCDMHLPDGFGDEIAASLGVPAIALSGSGPLERGAQARSCFKLHIEKPVDLDALEAAVVSTLSAHSPGG